MGEAGYGIGNVHLAAAGTYTFVANAGDSGANQGHIEMSIDDQTVIDRDFPVCQGEVRHLV